MRSKRTSADALEQSTSTAVILQPGEKEKVRAFAEKEQRTLSNFVRLFVLEGIARREASVDGRAS